jgi:hypothetical protein
MRAAGIVGVSRRRSAPIKTRQACESTASSARWAGAAIRMTNAKADSFMKTMKVEAVYPMAYETSEDVVENLPRFLEEAYNKR